MWETPVAGAGDVGGNPAPSNEGSSNQDTVMRLYAESSKEYDVEENEGITVHWSDAAELAAQAFVVNLQRMAEIILRAEERFLHSLSGSLSGDDSQD